MLAEPKRYSFEARFALFLHLTTIEQNQKLSYGDNYMYVTRIAVKKYILAKKLGIKVNSLTHDFQAKKIVKQAFFKDEDNRKWGVFVDTTQIFTLTNIKRTIQDQDSQ